MFTIEKGVPHPAGHWAGNRTLYPFLQMEVGDSFAVPLSGERAKAGRGSTDKTAAKLRASASSHSMRYPGVKFSVRTISAENIVRCWRIS